MDRMKSFRVFDYNYLYHSERFDRISDIRALPLYVFIMCWSLVRSSSSYLSGAFSHTAACTTVTFKAGVVAIGTKSINDIKGEDSFVANFIRH